jgi:hypothetical protein
MDFVDEEQDYYMTGLEQLVIIDGAVHVITARPDINMRLVTETRLVMPLGSKKPTYVLQIPSGAPFVRSQAIAKLQTPGRATAVASVLRYDRDFGCNIFEVYYFERVNQTFR